MFAVKGIFCDTPKIGELRYRTGYLVIEGKSIQGFFEKLPEKYEGIGVHDYSDRLIMPGFTDMHLHAPQYRNCGMAMDMPLLEWLDKYTFPEETRYADTEYAEYMYGAFTDELLKSATTRCVVFGTIHTDATMILMQKLEESGLIAMVGKVGMDRNAPADYCERSAEEGLKNTREWLIRCTEAGFKNVSPIITPRFTPCVSDEYMEGLSKLAREFNLPAQSHLSENDGEIKWVAELCPDIDFYGQSYDRYGLFGGETPTIMAHSIHCPKEEKKLMKERGVFIAHCPTSNENLISGIAPAAEYLREGYNIGLGTDISGGQTLNMFAVIVAAIQCSKLYTRCIDSSYPPLTMAEALYLATAGGRFFGKVGMFEPDYEFDAIIIDRVPNYSKVPYTVAEDLERYLYLGSKTPVAKYVAGRKVM